MRKGLFVVLLVFVLLLLPITKNQSHAATCSPQLGEVKVAGHAYTSSSIQDAYNYASDVLNLQPDFRLLLTGELFTENLLFDSGNVILDGGYVSNFIDKALPTSLLGSITIRNGSMIVAAGADTPTVISPLADCAFDSDGDSYTSIGSDRSSTPASPVQPPMPSSTRPTRRSSPMRRPPLRPGSGDELRPGTSRSVSTPSGSSPTTAPATSRGSGTEHAPRPQP